MVVKKMSFSDKPRSDQETQKKKALLVAQEISFAKVLAGNDKKLRDRGVKRLRKWLSTRSSKDFELTKDDFMRLWKGLFYCMWMADKPLFQEDLAETISSLVHCLKNSNMSIKFMDAFFKTMASEWKGIDQHRLDKFLMFVRRFLRQCLVYLEKNQWNIKNVEAFVVVFQSTFLPDHIMLLKGSQTPVGLVMHFVEIFLEELAKVSKGELAEEALLLFLKPFANHLAASRDGRIRSHIRRHIFMRLLEQSPVGLEFQDKFNAWRKLGFPGGSIDMMEKVDAKDSDGESDVEDEDEIISNALNGEEALDPRAGQIDVELPLINFNPHNVGKVLEEFRFKKYTNAKTRKILADLISKFNQLSEGDYPLGLKSVPEVPQENMYDLTEEAATNLMEFEAILNKENEEDFADSSKDEIDSSNGHNKQTTKTKKKDKKSRLLGKELKKDSNSIKEKPNRKEISHGKPKGKSVKNLKSKARASTGGDEPKDKDASDVDDGKSISIPKALQEKQESKTQVVQNTKSDISPISKEFSSESAGQSDAKIPSNMILRGKKKQKAAIENQSQLNIGNGVSETDSDLSIHSTLDKQLEKKSKKRKSLWDEDLLDGEYEIFIPRDTFVARKKKLSDANDSLSASGMKVKNPYASPVPGILPNKSGSSSKKVNFVLHKNTAQGKVFRNENLASELRVLFSLFILQTQVPINLTTSDYFRTLRENPAIPFDATKEPPRSVLRPSPYSSPINPFYKRKLKI